jgi:CBS-domain-containing membrane protein
MTTCQDVMTKAPICCLANDPVHRVAQVMRFENIGAVPVLEDYENRRLIGIVTDRDLALRVLGDKRDPQKISVADVMTETVWTCHPTDSLRVELDVMAEHQIRRIPVVDDSNQIVGIIAQADIATRVNDPRKAAEVLEQISLPNPNPVKY